MLAYVAYKACILFLLFWSPIVLYDICVSSVIHLFAVILASKKKLAFRGDRFLVCPRVHAESPAVQYTATWYTSSTALGMRRKWIYIAPLLKYLTLKALRYGSHSVTCKLHRTCLYLVSIHQMAQCSEWIHYFAQENRPGRDDCF